MPFVIIHPIYIQPVKANTISYRINQQTRTMPE